MADKTTTTPETTEVAEAPKAGAAPESGEAGGSKHAGHHHHDHGHGPQPLTIRREWLTEEAKKEQEEESGKPVENLPYSVKSEEKRPHSVLFLQIEVPAETFQKEIDRFYEKLRKEIVLPGFRKGKAPVKLIRIRMGDEADRDALAEISTNVLRQEVLKRDLKLITAVSIEKWAIKDGQPMTFEAEVELEPVIELKDYKGLKVQIEVQEAGEAEVNEKLEQIRRDCAKWEAAPASHKIEDGNAVSIDLKVVGADGQELKHLARENWLLSNYKAQLPETLAEKVAGAAEGDAVTAPVQNTRQNRRGDTIEYTDNYTATIRSVKLKKLPELDDELAKDLGEYNTLQELRDSIKADVAKADEERQRGAGLFKILQAVIEKNPMDIPKSLVAVGQYMRIQRDRREMERMGLQLEQVIPDPEAYMASREQIAEFEVKQRYVFQELARIEKLEAAEEDIEKEIARLAEESGRKPLAVRARLEAEKKFDALREQIAERKISDFLLANNAVEKTAPPAKPADAPAGQ